MNAVVRLVIQEGPEGGGFFPKLAHSGETNVPEMRHWTVTTR
jgi:hypothetical protein